MPAGIPPVITLSLILLLVALGGILSFFVGYPLLLWLRGLAPARPPPDPPEPLPTVSLLVAVRNGEKLVADKLANARALDYPADRLQIVFFSDGSTDRTTQILNAEADAQLTALSADDHVGKTEALNRGIAACRGDIVLFSDADALLDPDALPRLVRWFGDPGVGGVCGQRVIDKETVDLKEAQGKYIGLDSAIKRLESRRGSITSNDGKLYAIRRSLFRPIAPAVTDDLYICLAVVRQGFRFVFEPSAIARIHVPSRSRSHELRRRRRIVGRSLRGIFRQGALLNPFRYGWFAVGLAVNKIARRLLPVFLILLFIASLALAARWRPFAVFAGVQAAGYLAALLFPLLPDPLQRTLPGRVAGVANYFCLGCVGSLLGWADLVTGHEVLKWDPVKAP